jgi:hypothetical protein
MPNEGVYKRTPWHTATITSVPKVWECFQKYGADWSKPDIFGQCVPHAVAEAENIQVLDKMYNLLKVAIGPY